MTSMSSRAKSPATAGLDGANESSSGSESESSDSTSSDSDQGVTRAHYANHPQFTKNEYRNFTRADRGAVDAVNTLEAEDLAFHLYQAHRLKRRLYSTDETDETDVKPEPGERSDVPISASCKRKARWIENEDEEWRPRKHWTAWPLEASDVPPAGKSFLKRDDGVSEIDALGLANPAGWERKLMKPSEALEECLIAAVSRKAREHFTRRKEEFEADRTLAREERRRSRELAKEESVSTRSEESPAPEGKTDSPSAQGDQANVHSERNSKRSPTRKTSEAAVLDQARAGGLYRASRRISGFGTLSFSGHDIDPDDSLDDENDPEDVMQEDQPINPPQSQRDLGVENDQTALQDGTESDSDSDDEERFRAMPLLDDDKARRILRQPVRHIISSLDELLAGLDRTRQNHVDAVDSEGEGEEGEDHSGSKSRSRSRSSRKRSRGSRSRSQSSGRDRSSSRGRLSRPERQARLGLRDWSEVLGTAAMMGWDPAAIDRAHQRCKALFGEDMEFRSLGEATVARDRADLIEASGSGDSDMEGGVHVDGFLQPVPPPKGRGADRKKRRKRNNA